MTVHNTEEGTNRLFVHRAVELLDDVGIQVYRGDRLLLVAPSQVLRRELGDGPHQLTLAGEHPYVWVATVEAGGLHAQAHVENGPVHLTGLTIADLFSELAEHWRGWDGNRVWSNNEGSLQLTATHDGLGNVELEVLLTPLSDPWTATAILELEAAG